ncbi:ABC transporter permease [Pseudobacteroides cellulosolvens]|uniref:ABC-type transporter, integral membrane subunit n=1 Tax=Pseudobacteroides cellulosolvens ATCC 35603 = DSM 2933 TaxID=398512 RepID=A0A0L6JWA3_9FIRM|nr:ABC transporter permease [Pseudobacteroides cellulosolvens]KNY30146.1 ABC-type transporter, integral membrane subunit [Pseudobacteroides cellulosolvens ATCC 35603 = DSM 2933]
MSELASNITSKINIPSFLKPNRRQHTLIMISLSSLVLIGIILASVILSNERIATHFDLKNLGPSLSHPFGTDWLGRDMFTRTVKGLSLSIYIGIIASAVSVAVALVLGLCAATMGKAVDSAITWMVDLFQGMPHLVALILIAFTVGGGAKGVIIGVALTHWTSLTRVIRAEILQLRTAQYVQISRHMGKSRWWIAVHHMLPHLVPQFLVGFVLLFPHAILHEASITFLGFGLSPHKPAIGVILSESMKYLSTGMWWLAFFPGISLLIIVRSFDIIGENLRLLIDPHNANE